MVYRSFLVFAAVLFISTLAFAQDARPDMAGPPPDGRDGGRPNLLAALNLSPEQVQEMRRLNQQRRPVIQEAQRRLRDANHALDEAIYADVVNDADVQARLKDFQIAQAEVFKLRFQNELAVRKLLTAEQLTKFRELRRSFEENRQKFRQNRPPADQFRPRRGAGQRPPNDL